MGELGEEYVGEHGGEYVDFICERSQQSICLAGVTYQPHELAARQNELEQQLAQQCAHAPDEVVAQLRFELELLVFLRTWFDDNPELEVKTSGSTGTPKVMSVSKERMMNSARLTLEFLQLKRGDRALLCMPLEYIAGKMVVRALVGGLDLQVVAPCGHPLQKVAADLDFAAMIPLQVYNSLQKPGERARLAAVKQLIIGGGAIDAALEQELRSFPHKVWSTYGMTETLSHIALRRLNGPEASQFYQPFAQVKLSLSPEDTLVIEAPQVSAQTLVTNDIVVFNDQGQFRIKGRKDNVINSGGIKLQIEELEAQLKALQPQWDFLISSQPHPKFGQVVVLLLTKRSLPSELGELSDLSDPNELSELSEQSSVRAFLQTQLRALTRFARPKRYLLVDELPRTGTNKPDRAAAQRLAQRAQAELFTV